MSNATQEPGCGSQIPAPCPVFPAWCDESANGHTEHYGEPDVEPAIATARADQLRSCDDGILVASVRVGIHADRTWDADRDPTISVVVLRPDNVEAEVRMTAGEADVLRRHLEQAIGAAS